MQDQLTAKVPSKGPPLQSCPMTRIGHTFFLLSHVSLDLIFFPIILFFLTSFSPDDYFFHMKCCLEHRDSLLKFSKEIIVFYSFTQPTEAFRDILFTSASGSSQEQFVTEFCVLHFLFQKILHKMVLFFLFVVAILPLCQALLSSVLILIFYKCDFVYIKKNLYFLRHNL